MLLPGMRPLASLGVGYRDGEGEGEYYTGLGASVDRFLRSSNDDRSGGLGTSTEREREEERGEGGEGQGWRFGGGPRRPLRPDVAWREVVEEMEGEMMMTTMEGAGGQEARERTLALAQEQAREQARAEDMMRARRAAGIRTGFGLGTTTPGRRDESI